MRIVSLLPSATEIVCALGLSDHLVGVTHECDFPAAARQKRRVTMTHIPTDRGGAEIDRMVRERRGETRALYSLDLDALREARPDLIISQTLCDVCAVSEGELCAALKAMPGVRLLNLEPTRFHDVIGSFLDVGRAAGAADAAERLVQRLRRRIDAVREVASDASGWDWSARRTRMVVLEWLNPLFSSGHWTPDLVELAGGVEALARGGARSRVLREAELMEADADLILIACCGWTAERAAPEAAAFLRRPGIRALRCVRDGRVYLSDGSAYFSRPGPRLVDSLEVLAHAIRPDVAPPPLDAPAATPIAFGDLAEVG